MKKLVGLFGLLALFVAPVLAQETPAPPQDQPPTAPTEPVKAKRTYPTPKADVSVGFTYRKFYGVNAQTIGMKGGYASFDYNFFSWLAAEGEFLGVSGTLATVPAEDIRIFTAMAGPKITPFGHRRFTPYGHVLYGAGIDATAVPAFAGYPGSSGGKVVHSWEVGGGLDYNRWPHWGIRLIEVDYGEAKFLGNTIPKQGSGRISFGIVYRFGDK